jgi:hypothetical protein
MKILRTAIVAAGVLSAVAGWAQPTFTLTSPTNNAFVKRSSTFTYNITGATEQVTVKLTATGPGGFQTTVERKDDPNTDGKISGNLTLSLSQSAPEGRYSVQLTATEEGKTYPTITRTITVDGTAPKFLDFNPVGSVFVKGKVRITANLDEPNIEEWRVQVGGADIPNNIGTSKRVDVLWDTDTIEGDGQQTVTIIAKDKAGNEGRKDITVVIDRVRPSARITFPKSTTGVKKRSTFLVQVEVIDAGSVDVTGVDVLLYTTGGKYIMRVPRVTHSINGSTFKYTGRVRSNISLPSKFNIVVRSVDRAGNVGLTQTVTIPVKG